MIYVVVSLIDLEYISTRSFTTKEAALNYVANFIKLDNEYWRKHETKDIWRSLTKGLFMYELQPDHEASTIYEYGFFSDFPGNNT